MTKFYKFTAYLLDVNEDFKNFDDHLAYINQVKKYGSDIQARNIQVAEIEWDDDIDINQFGCTQAQMDAYFEKNMGSKNE